MKPLLTRLQARELAECLAQAIREYIFGEGGLVEYAREIRNQDPNVPLPEETPTTVGEILWCETDEAEMARAAKLCGVIAGHFELARSLEIELPEDSKTLADWADTINPNP
jgi:hypothetical protein